MELPGASAPPELIVVDDTVPVPPRMPPLLTVTPLDKEMSPFTLKVPAFTVVAPV